MVHGNEGVACVQDQEVSLSWMHRDTVSQTHHRTPAGVNHAIENLRPINICTTLLQDNFAPLRCGNILYHLNYANLYLTLPTFANLCLTLPTYANLCLTLPTFANLCLNFANLSLIKYKREIELSSLFCIW